MLIYIETFPRNIWPTIYPIHISALNYGFEVVERNSLCPISRGCWTHNDIILACHHSHLEYIVKCVSKASFLIKKCIYRNSQIDELTKPLFRL